MNKMNKRKQMVVYWDTEKDAKLIEELERLAEEERRSRSATVLVALKEYIERHGKDDWEPKQTRQLSGAQ